MSTKSRTRVRAAAEMQAARTPSMSAPASAASAAARTAFPNPRVAEFESMTVIGGESVSSPAPVWAALTVPESLPLRWIEAMASTSPSAMTCSYAS